jgi:hypothetical protein
MDDTYWHKQTPNKPLFEELIWNKPENKLHAGKLLIIGGNMHGFSAPAQAYQIALNEGAGEIKVVLPDALKKSVGTHLEFANFAPSNKSGGFNKQSLAEWLDYASWSDCVLIAGDLGHNSETAIALEQFTIKYQEELILTNDALNSINDVANIAHRAKTTLVVNLKNLQRICLSLKCSFTFTHEMPNNLTAQNLHLLSLDLPINIIFMNESNIFVATGGKVSSTPKISNQTSDLFVASKSAVWFMQNKNKPFQALTTAVLPQ